MWDEGDAHVDDRVIITEAHHLRIMVQGSGVRFVALQDPHPDDQRDFPDVDAAMAYACSAYGATATDWKTAPFPVWAMVCIRDTDPNTELHGLTGYVAALSTPDQVHVFIDTLEEVWCLHPSDVEATGGFLPQSERPDPARRVRVSPSGDLL